MPPSNEQRSQERMKAGSNPAPSSGGFKHEGTAASTPHAHCVEDSASIPQLEPRCGSWIVTSPDGKRVRELFLRSNVERAVEAGWKVETTLQWLARLNREERS